MVSPVQWAERFVFIFGGVKTFPREPFRPSRQIDFRAQNEICIERKLVSRFALRRRVFSRLVINRTKKNIMTKIFLQVHTYRKYIKMSPKRILQNIVDRDGRKTKLIGMVITVMQNL